MARVRIPAGLLSSQRTTSPVLWDRIETSPPIWALPLLTFSRLTYGITSIVSFEAISQRHRCFFASVNVVNLSADAQRRHMTTSNWDCLISFRPRLYRRLRWGRVGQASTTSLSLDDFHTACTTGRLIVSPSSFSEKVVDSSGLFNGLLIWWGQLRIMLYNFRVSSLA